MNYAPVSHTGPSVADPATREAPAFPWELENDLASARQETWLLSFIDILALLLTLFVLLLAIQDRQMQEPGDEIQWVTALPSTGFGLLGSLDDPFAGLGAAGGEGWVASGPLAGAGNPVTGAAPAPAVPTSVSPTPAAGVAGPLPGPAVSPSAVVPGQVTPADESVPESVAATDTVVSEPASAPTTRAAPGATTVAQEHASPEGAGRGGSKETRQPRDGRGPGDRTTAAAVAVTPDLLPQTDRPPTRAARGLRQRLDALALATGVEVIARPGAINLEISDSILFRPASAALSAPGLELLRQLSEILRTLPYEVSVEGHTDNVPIHTPRYPSNWELSTARATQVTRRLIALGVAGERLRAIGYGATRPREDNLSAASRAKNRRVTLVLAVAGAD